MGLFFVFVVLTSLAVCLAGVASNPELDRQIDSLRFIVRETKEKPENRHYLADAWRKLGILLQSKDIRHHQGGGQLQPEALEAFDKALELDDGKTAALSIQVYYLRGILLKMMSRGEEALQSLDRVLEYKLSKSDKASVYFHKGEAYLLLGQIPKASQFYRQSIKLLPCKTDRYYSYVQSCREIKAMKKDKWADLLTEIRSILKSCMAGEEVDPMDFKEYDQHLKELAREEQRKEKRGSSGDIDGIRIATDDDEDDEGDEEDELDGDDDEDEEVDYYGRPSYLQMGDGNGDGDTANIENSSVYWALYIAAEKAERYSLAWWYLEKANTLEKNSREIKFNPDDARAQQQQVTTVFQKGFWDSLPDMSGESSRVPIFIVGMMRSGSTLLETMLDSHGQIWGMGEDSLFNGNLTAFRDALVKASSIPVRSEQVLAVEQVLKDYGTGTARKMRKLALQKLAETSNSSSSSSSSSSSVDSAVETSVKNSIKSKKLKHVVDKMLFNYRNIGFIHLVYPDALIVHTMRDPMDTLFSCYRNKFDDFGLEWSLDWSDLVLQYVMYLEIMHHWRTVLPGRVVDLRYEDLIENPEAVMRNLIVNKLKLKWDENVMNFHSNNRSVHTHSQSQVRQNIYKHSIGSWRRYAKQLQPMIDEMKKYLPRLIKNKALPYMDKINWQLEVDFPYEEMFGGATGGGSSESSERDSSDSKKNKDGDKNRSKNQKMGSSRKSRSGSSSSSSDGEDQTDDEL